MFVVGEGERDVIFFCLAREGLGRQARRRQARDGEQSQGPGLVLPPKGTVITVIRY